MMQDPTFGGGTVKSIKIFATHTSRTSWGRTKRVKRLIRGADITVRFSACAVSMTVHTPALNAVATGEETQTKPHAMTRSNIISNDLKTTPASILFQLINGFRDKQADVNIPKEHPNNSTNLKPQLC